MTVKKRAEFSFEQKVREAFSFLRERGFKEVEATPTLVRYQKGNVEVDIYHGRQSYEVGAGISAFGVRYSMSEIVRGADPQVAKTFHQAVATTTEGISAALEVLELLMIRYAAQALNGDRKYFSALDRQREQWSEDYALDVLADQLRPQAEDAFHRGDYAMASDLYARIRSRLTPAEIKKLGIAQSRSVR